MKVTFIEEHSKKAISHKLDGMQLYENPLAIPQELVDDDHFHRGAQREYNQLQNGKVRSFRVLFRYNAISSHVRAGRPLPFNGQAALSNEAQSHDARCHATGKRFLGCKLPATLKFQFNTLYTVRITVDHSLEFGYPFFPPNKSFL